MTGPVDSTAVRDVVHQLGGPAKVGRALGTTTEAVCNWMARDNVPHGRRMGLWRLAHGAGLTWRPPGMEGVTLEPAAPAANENPDPTAQVA